MGQVGTPAGEESQHCGAYNELGVSVSVCVV